MGGYPVGRSFWGFLVVGSWAMFFVAMIAGVPFLLLGQRTSAGIAYAIVYWGYFLAAAVGTWRAANGRISSHSLKGGGAVVGTKLFVLLYALAMLNAHYATALRLRLDQM